MINTILVDIRTNETSIQDEIVEWCASTFAKDTYSITPSCVRLVYKRNKPPLWMFSDDAFLMFRLRWEDEDGVRMHILSDEDLNKFRKIGKY